MNNYYDYGKDPLIGIDIETKDPNLLDKGPGVYRKDGHIVGVSFSNGNLSEYYPLAHHDTGSVLREKNERYIKDQLSTPNRKVFANGMYDLDWLKNGWGVPVKGTFEDIQIAEPLLDEYRYSYSLDNLSKDYLGKGKAYDGIADYAVKKGWIQPGQTKKAVGHFWKMPQSVGEEYASEDARLTVEVFKKQIPKVEQQELWSLYRMEMGLYPLLLQMRKNGVMIDEAMLRKLGIVFTDIRYDQQAEINNIADFEVNVGSNKDLETMFKKLDIPIVYKSPTEKMVMQGKTRGNPTFNEDALKKVNHEVAKKILKLRHVSTLINLFIHPYPDILVNGRIHCRFNQLKSDEYGTVSGRFSSSQPNLQQVSDEKEDMGGMKGKLIRQLFLPEVGCDWAKLDWSQIEFRLMAHYARGEGADTIRERYNKDRKTDYHTEVMEMAGIESRDDAKKLNFGTAYGMGIKLMAAKNGWSMGYAKMIYKRYHEKIPFVKETSNRVAMKARRVGFIRTILNRRARLRDPSKAYVMFNRLIQGGSADLMKMAMVRGYKEGIFNTLAPHLTVHDELDVSVPRTKEGKEALRELGHIMENCVKLKIPILVDIETGPNWGQVEELENWR